MGTIVHMIDVLNSILMNSDLTHLAPEIVVVIPALNNSAMRRKAIVDWKRLEPIKKDDETIVKFAGTEYHIWDDFRDYSGKKDNREDIDTYLASYSKWFYNQENKSPNGTYEYLRFDIYWKPLVRKERSL